MAANSNGFAWGEIDSTGSRLTRMLLKADDGELHLGNTTINASALADDKEDPQYARALIHMRYEGDLSNDPYYKPEYDYDALRRLEVVGPRDENGKFLIRVQPYLGMHDMCIWQLHVNNLKLREEVTEMKQMLLENYGTGNS